jgi:HSP20 family protein
MIVKAFHNHWFERPWSALSWASQVASFDALRDELERSSFAPERVLDNTHCTAAQAAPDFQISDEGPELKLSASLPGIAQDGLDLKLTADRMELRGERKLSIPEGYKARHRERQSYAFERTYRLPIKIDPGRSEASLVNGVLTITLPKAEAAKPRSITVRSS